VPPPGSIAMRGPLVDVEDFPPYPESYYEPTWRGSAVDLTAPDAIVPDSSDR
jgi:hypothetical protein